jgi:hypothetical protein
MIFFILFSPSVGMVFADAPNYNANKVNNQGKMQFEMYILGTAWKIDELCTIGAAKAAPICAF